ncbi:hypothetical protein BC937DRAFT_88887 [Endogone sp. FLAS-F59071]|nr:hypothetical protein BC937DRAFT_88887 [Endogone sp. FLAS-F59071]|eukprot:RUS23420.1 hypothetical protein BC937DRAFT_88887 [Endogone sp. FLAS-F59071]
MIQFPFNVALCVENLHLGDILKVARSMLFNIAGVYGFQNIKTGEIVYVGSAVNLWVRFYQHITVAGSLQGYKHTPESLAKMSGENNPMFGKSQEDSPTFGRTGALHPMFGKKGADAPNFGKTPANAKPVYLDDTKTELIRPRRGFNSQDQCARWLNVSNRTVTRYLSSGKVLNNQYLLTSSLY